MGRDGLQAPGDFLEKGGPQPWLLRIVVLRSLVEFALGEPVELE